MQIQTSLDYVTQFQVHGCAEENADSLTQPLFSTDDFLPEEDFSDGLTKEDRRSIFSACLNADQQINSDMHKNHSEPENSPPQVYCYFLTGIAVAYCR